MNSSRRVPWVAGLLLAGLALRPQIIGMGPLLVPIQRDLSLSHSVAGLVTSIPLFCMGLAAPLAGPLAARMGTSRALGGGLMLIAVSGAVRAAAPSGVSLLAVTVPLGLGMAVSNALLPVAVKSALPDQPVLGTGAYSIGILLGGAVAALVVVPLAVGLGGWRASLGVLAAASGLSVLGWAALAGRRGLRQTGSTNGTSSRRIRLPWRSALAWQLASLLALLATSFYGLSTWLPAAFVERGWTDAQAAHLLAVYSFAMVPATLIVMVLGEKLPSPRTLMTAMGLLLMASTVMLIEQPGGAYIWASLAGAAQGILFTIALTLPLAVARQPSEVAAVAGLMLGVGYSLGAFAPFVLGGIRDLTGSFVASLWIMAAAALAIVVNVAAFTSGRLERGMRGTASRVEGRPVASET